MKISSLKLVLTILLFLLAGELVIRIDKNFNIFGHDTVVQIKEEIRESDEMTLLKNNSLVFNDQDLRILVLGDSYIFGAEVDYNQNFTHQLKRMLLSENLGQYKTVYTLDVSRPSNNSLDNYNAYFSFVNRFKPQIVILGYNINDLIDSVKSIESLSVKNSVELPGKVHEKTSTISRIYNILYVSDLLQFTLHNTNKFLKSKGIIIPNSEFDQEISAYYKNKPDWLYSKEILTRMILDSKAVNSEFIVLLLPQIDLVKYRKIFSRTDNVIKEFFQQFSNVRFLNLRDSIDVNKAAGYVISRYDEHPNEKGHQFMAETVNRLIMKELNSKSGVKK